MGRLDSALHAHWPALDSLLDEALELPPSARPAWLAAHRGAWPAGLGDALARLLALDAAADRPTDARSAAPGSMPSPLDRPPASPEAADAAAATAPPGPVGPWRLLRLLGEGGMASVWLAERTDGLLRRQVALKLPHAAWVPGLAARMARERDILASLAHPHIARLYDAGIDDQGRPWLALEHVQGQPIDRHARAAGLDVRQRIGLLLQVCDAVAAAHRSFVIHRDLKPANILVTGQGQVKLLDFGIAKLLDGEQQADTAITRIGGAALTLDYASPEQLRGEPLTTASDVYSLGVVAHELLTGVRPQAPGPESAADRARAIAEADLPAASRRCADAATARALRGDLDAILAQALQAAPERRYSGVDALRDDLQRHLDGDAVRARPPAWSYRMGRLLHRHRLPVASAATVVLALLIGTGLALWQAGQARDAATRADTERQAARQAEAAANASGQQARDQAARAEAQRDLAERATLRAAQAAALARHEAARAQAAVQALQRTTAEAQHQAQRAEQVKQFALSLFEQADTQTGAGRQTTALELLQKARIRIDRELAAEPAIRHELQLSLAISLQSLGDTDSAMALAETVAGQATGEPLRTEATVLRAELLTSQGRFPEALALCQQLEQQTRGRQDVLRLSVLRLLAVQLHRDGRYPESVERARQAVAVGDGPPALPALPRLRAWMTLANNLHLARQPGAGDAAGRAVALAQQLYADPKAEPLLEAQQMQAQALVGEGRLAEGVAQYRALLSARRALLGDRHSGLAAIYNGLGNAQLQLGDHAGALATYRALVEVTDHNDRGATVNRSIARYRVGTALLALSRDGEAAQTLAEAVAMRRTAGSEGNVLVGWQLNQAIALAGLGRHAEADDLLRLTEQASPSDEFDRQHWRLLRASVRLRQDRPADALALADAALTYFAAQANPTMLHRLQLLRAKALVATDAPAAALRALGAEQPTSTATSPAASAHSSAAAASTAFAIARTDAATAGRMAPAGSRMVATDQPEADLVQARALLALGHPEPARAASLRSVQGWERLRPGSPAHGLALGWHARVLLALGDQAGAAAAARQALATIGTVHRPDEQALVDSLTARWPTANSASTAGSQHASGLSQLPFVHPATRSVHATADPPPAQD